MDKQKKAPDIIFLEQEAFGKLDHTEVRWLGNGGAFLNSHGTCLMIDPLLSGFDMPLLREAPVRPEQVPHLDAVLITHSDNDHFSRNDCLKLGKVCREFHAPRYVAGLLQELGISAIGHDIGEIFQLGEVEIRLTPADHAWQNVLTPDCGRLFKMEDFCGYFIDTEDGKIWMPGDSRLMEEQLLLPEADLILLDFSEGAWHLGLDGAKRLTEQYPKAGLLPIHWGCVHSDMPEFNGDPEKLREKITNPDRLKVMAPGEPWLLKKRGKDVSKRCILRNEKKL